MSDCFTTCIKKGYVEGLSSNSTFWKFQQKIYGRHPKICVCRNTNLFILAIFIIKSQLEMRPIL